MNNLIKYVVFSIATLLYSCGENFVDLNPISSVNIDGLYQSEKDFYDAFPPVYDVLQSIYNDFWMFGDLRADDAWQEIIKNDSRSYMDLFTTSSTDGLISSQWNLHYRGIYRLNVILDRLYMIDDTWRVPFIGEAQFLRALLYFNLVRIWGDVPLVTAPLTVEESYLTGRDKSNLIYEIIIEDLEGAVKYLPDHMASRDVGKPTKGAALAILGRVHLYLGDFRKCEEVLSDVVNSSNYKLLDDYGKLWDYSDKHHSEYIFDVEYEEGIGEGTSLGNRFLPNSQEFFKFYGLTSREGGECNSPSQILMDLFESSPGDSRKFVTIGTPGGFYDNDSNFIKLPGNTSQTYTLKYMVPFENQDDTRCNWKIIRYGDVLLMLAEALNENDKLDQALSYLNIIRERAGVRSYSESEVDKPSLRNLIWLERRLELSFEGVRWFDLIRTGKAFETMKDFGMKEFMTVFPIPQEQLDIINDKSIFPQNNGY